MKQLVLFLVVFLCCSASGLTQSAKTVNAQLHQQLSSGLMTYDSICQECDEEAIRVVKNMPKWTPASNRGEAVNSYYHLPVKFESK